METAFKKRDALHQAAVKVFAECGFKNASLNTILQNAKVSKGVFYHYYESKESLYVEITGILLEKKKSFIKSKLQLSDLEGDVFHILKRSMVLGFEFGASNPDLSRFSTMLMRERGTPIFEKVMARYNVNNDEYVSHLIKKGITNGNIKADFSYDFVYNMISFLLSNVNEILDTHSAEDYAEKIDALLRFLEHGLKAK